MGAQRPQKVANVVADGLEAQVQLGGDLARRVSVLEQAQDFSLARREVRVRLRLRRSLVAYLPEDTHDSTAAVERHRADVDLHAITVGIDDHDVVMIGGLCRSGDLACERLARATHLFGCDHRGELPPDDVADDPLCRRVRPANDAGVVDHVARNVDVLQRMLDVGVHRIECGHGGESSPCFAQVEKPAIAFPRETALPTVGGDYGTE